MLWLGFDLWSGRLWIRFRHNDRARSDAQPGLVSTGETQASLRGGRDIEVDIPTLIRHAQHCLLGLLFGAGAVVASVWLSTEGPPPGAMRGL